MILPVNPNNRYNIQNPKFGAGKVRVFSDFDRTFLPSKHKPFAMDYNIGFVNYIRDYFLRFKKFLDNTKGNLEFTITTGRTFGEFAKMCEISRERKFGMPLPDTLIVKNGSDEHIRTGTDEEFYNGGALPFKYDVTNKKKEEKLKQMTGWDGPKLKEKLKELFKSKNLRIVEADSEHSPVDYGERSLFAPGKLPYETGKVFEGTDKAEWSVGFRNDGNCKIFITYPYDMFCVRERFDTFEFFADEINNIKKELNITNTRGAFSRGEHENECGGRPYITIEPNVVESMGCDPHSNGLSKLYDTREAVKLARQNNDLVIAAGDSSNDMAMLNPGLYLKEALEKYGTTHNYKPSWAEYPYKLIDMMEDDPELAQAFKELPFVGVIVKNDKKFKSFSDLVKCFGEGKYKKIIVVEQGHLQDGIKEAIKLYSEHNPEYKEKLSADFRKEINRKDGAGNIISGEP